MQAQDSGSASSALKPIFVPDTHGHYQKVMDLLQQLNQQNLLQGRKLIFLGDYVDRGPDVRALIELMLRLQMRGHACIAGNHDLVMRAVLTPGPHLPAWVARWRAKYACDRMLRSYGTSLAEAPDDADAVPTWLRAHLPPAHIQFLCHLPLFYEQACYIAVHAGLEPVRRIPGIEPLLVKGIMIRSWAEQRAELLLMEHDPALLFEGMGPRQSCLYELADQRFEDAMPEGRCIVSGHWHREVAYFSHSRALIHMGVDYEGPLTAWIPDQKLLVTTRQTIALNMPKTA